MKSKISLGELLGSKVADSVSGRRLSMEDLPHLLGDARPEMPINTVGRYRLLSSLRNRFGAGYRNIPGVMDIVKDFDEKLRVEKLVESMKQIKYTPPKKEK